MICNMRGNACRYPSPERRSCVGGVARRTDGCFRDGERAGTCGDGYRMPGTKTGVMPAGWNRNDFCQMREKLMALYFVVVELELYLDGHPDNADALARYRCAVNDYKAMAEKFEKQYGPLTAEGNRCENEWLWARLPWPWEG